MKNVLVVGLVLAFGSAYAQSGGDKGKPAAGAPAAKPAAGAPAAAPAAKPAAGAPAAAPAAKPGEKPAAGAAMEPPAPPKAGPETEALKPFMPKSATISGKSPAGAWAPGSPEMPTKGKIACKWMLNNLWAACDIEDTTGTGKTAMHWMAHQLAGWDFGAKEYRAILADNMGGAALMKGKLDGTKLTLESATESFMMGQPMKFRVTFDAADPKAIKLTSEHTGPDKKWVVDEESTIKVGGGK